MSLENAILEHAGALKELAAAIKSMGSGMMPFAKLKMSNADAEFLDKKEYTVAEVATHFPVPEPMAYVNRVLSPEEVSETLAKADAQDAVGSVKVKEEDFHEVVKVVRHLRDMEKYEDTAPAIEQGDPEIEEAVEQIEAAALDYKTDVRPVLLQVAKVKSKDALQCLLTKFGAKTGDALKPEQYAAIVTEANKLLAG